MENLGSRIATKPVKRFPKIVAMFVIAACCVSLLVAANDRRQALKQMDDYAASGKPSAAIIGDLSKCFKERPTILPFDYEECGGRILKVHGPAAMDSAAQAFKSMAAQ